VLGNSQDLVAASQWTWETESGTETYRPDLSGQGWNRTVRASGRLRWRSGG